MVDFKETRTPPEVTEKLRAAGILGKNIGIYRIVGQAGVPEEMWNGTLTEPAETAELSFASTRILVRRLELDCKVLLQRLTYGALGFILDYKIGTPESDYWTPQIIRDLGFLTADRKRATFYHYLEVLPHVTECAWDSKA